MRSATRAWRRGSAPEQFVPSGVAWVAAVLHKSSKLMAGFAHVLDLILQRSADWDDAESAAPFVGVLRELLGDLTRRSLETILCEPFERDLVERLHLLGERARSGSTVRVPAPDDKAVVEPDVTTAMQFRFDLDRNRRSGEALRRARECQPAVAETGRAA